MCRSTAEKVGIRFLSLRHGNKGGTEQPAYPRVMNAIEALRFSASEADKSRDWQRAADLCEQLSHLSKLSFLDHYRHPIVRNVYF